MAPKSSTKSLVPDMGLSASETRVLLLGMVLSVDGKVDFAKLADRAGYTPGSARTLYNGARRKLFQLHGDDAADRANQTDTASPAKKARKSTAGRKRKHKATDAPAIETATEEIDENVFIKGEFDDD